MKEISKVKIDISKKKVNSSGVPKRINIIMPNEPIEVSKQMSQRTLY